jgi:hypothetical protein
VYTTSTYRPWRRIDVSAFQEAVRSSALCSIVNDSRDDGAEQLAALYDSETNAIADRLVPLKSVTRRYRPSSDPWHDDDCRAARRRCQRLERRAKRRSEFVDAAREELRSYRALVRQKRSDFCCNTIESQRRNRRHMRQSIDNLVV